METLSKFYTAVVVEYFAKPIESTEQVNDLVKKYEKSKTPIIYPNRLFTIPRGSILARYIDNSEKPDVRIFYPFFSHISLPLKAGEQVFVQDNGIIGYWFTRKTSDLIAEDPNFTHNDRSNFSSVFIRNEQTTGTVNPVAKLFPEDSMSGISYREIVGLSDSLKKEFIGEAVPRYSTASTDLSLQGSNNSLIVLGSSSTLGKNLKNTGLIDIVVGRGQSDNTTPGAIFENARKYEESDKTSNQNLSEGDLDLVNDLSRIHVTMNMDPDESFSTNIPNSTYQRGSAPTIVNKTNKFRIIARNDASISVEGENGCSIVLNDNGSIYINPGTSGKVYLNGPNSNQPYLRYDEFKSTINRLVDMVAALQTTINTISLAAASAAAGGPAAIQAAINATSLVDPGTTAIDVYVQQVNALLGTIKSKKILGS